MLKRWRIVSLLAVVISLSIFISACGGEAATPGGTPTQAATQGGSTAAGGPTCVQGSLTASGSTALAPLVKAVAEDYQKKCPGATITVNLGGSGTGLSQVESGAVDIGNSDVFSKPGQEDLVDHQVAVVIFAVIVNEKVGVTNLTTQQLKDIYGGKVTNWNQVGGPDQKIVVVSRPTSSGTRQTFQNYVLGGPEVTQGPQNLTTDSTSTVIQNVAQNAGAIGYAATGPLKQATGVKTITIDGNAPTADLVKNNTYKFWAAEHMYTKGQPKPLAKALLDYMVSDFGAEQAKAQGFVAIKDMDPAVLNARTK
ncbi:MAG: phosphate ABC transporter substrate-binding protein [Ktedonobacteraceae bacterium]|nr:phosphate ABC transporter substrate-binding protein [Ktedonobacteraceae bacterium]